MDRMFVVFMLAEKPYNYTEKNRVEVLVRHCVVVFMNPSNTTDQKGENV